MFVTLFTEQWLTNKNHLSAIIGAGTVLYMLLVQLLF